MSFNINIGEVCVLTGSAVNGRVFSYPGEADACDILIYVEGADASFLPDGAPLFNFRDAALLIPGGRGYGVSLSPGANYTAAAFRAYDGSKRIVFPREILFSPPLGDYFHKLALTSGSGGSAAEVRRKELILGIFRSSPGDWLSALKPEFARISAGVLALEEQFTKNTPVAEYAALCNLRENRFRTLFTEFYGVSPVERRNNLRLKYAQSLITDCRASVHEAAAAAGFGRASYFCRLHRKVFGTSPALLKEDEDGTLY